MKKELYTTLIIFSVIIVSVLIMIVPTFFTKGVSRVSLKQEIDLPLILNDEKEVKLLFFGYSGCTDICTPRLYAISDLYNNLNENIKKRVGLEFLDISSPYDKTLPLRFAQFFNQEFKGIYLSPNVLREYTKIFNVYFSKSLLNDMEYDHTANLYLVKKTKGKKELRYIYNSYPYDIKQIIIDIKELLNE